ncbi:MAG: LysM peptidoglycan-binding domain-containing protein [Chloroflexota bacterium]
MRRIVSYSILIVLCATTIGTGVVVATVFGSTGLPETEGVPMVTATPTSAIQVLPTTAPVSSPTSQRSAPELSSTPPTFPAQPTRTLILPTTEMVSAPTDEPLPTIDAPTPSALVRNDADYIEYTVRSGDLLYTIALENDVTVEDILTINSIENPDSLVVDSIIRIPQ